MPEPLSQLEQLLETLGSQESPGDTQHRYALRRALLRSDVFAANRSAMKWFRVFTVTGSALAGGLVVTVMFISVNAMGSVHNIEPAPVLVQVVESVPVDEVDGTKLASSGEEQPPNVSLVDFSQYITKESMDKWVAAPIEFATVR